MNIQIQRLVHSRYLFALTGSIWWLAFYPGFYSADSFGVLSQIKNGSISNSYTCAWPLVLQVLTFGGKFPALGTLFCVLIFSYSVQYFIERVVQAKLRPTISFIFLVSPLVGVMGVTLWHDIPMTAGFLFITAIAASSNLFTKTLASSEWIHLVLAACLVSLRPNGLPVLILFFVMALLVRRQKVLLKIGAIAVGITLIFSILTTLIAGQATMFNSWYAQEWMRSDIACEFSNHPEAFSSELELELSAVAPLSTWKNPSGCTFLNNLKLDPVQQDISIIKVPKIWRELFFKKPLNLLAIHITRNDYLLPIPTFRAMHPPFIQSNIEQANQGISFALPSVAEKLRIYPRLWNALRPVTSFAGLWILLVSILLIVKRKSPQLLLPPYLMSISLIFILFIFAPIPDGRYALFVLVASQILILDYVLSKIRSRSKVKK